MKRSIHLPIIVRALILVSGMLTGAQAAADAKGGLVAPPAVYLPYGAKVVTELNFSDDDILGVIKQIIPVLGDFAAIGMKSKMPSQSPIDSAAAANIVSSLDFKTLAEAVDGVKNVRVLMATYRPGLKNEVVLKQLEAGAAKAGSFRKIASDIALIPGAFALYAEANGDGYMAFAYDAKGGMLYAGRVVGRVDVPKIVKWAGELGKAFMGAMGPPTGQPPVEQKTE